MSNTFTPKTIRLMNKGAEKVLGELEFKIMKLIWKSYDVTVREIRDELEECHKDLSFNSVMTIMNRLVKKGVLEKDHSQKVNRYTARMSEETFTNFIARDMIAAVIQDPALFSASSFATIAEQLDKKTIQKLKKLINANTKE